MSVPAGGRAAGHRPPDGAQFGQARGETLTLDFRPFPQSPIDKEKQARTCFVGPRLFVVDGGRTATCSGIGKRHTGHGVTTVIYFGWLTRSVGRGGPGTSEQSRVRRGSRFGAIAGGSPGNPPPAPVRQPSRER